jgi:hypothetical protein
MGGGVKWRRFVYSGKPIIHILLTFSPSCQNSGVCIKGLFQKEYLCFLSTFLECEWKSARGSKALLNGAKTAAAQFLKKDARIKANIREQGSHCAPRAYPKEHRVKNRHLNNRNMPAADRTD